jgi:Family of unknown function (DUF6191)
VGVVFAMTLPGLVIVLVGGALTLRITRGLGRGTRDHATASTSFDVLSELLNPSDGHRLQEQRREAMRRDDAADGAPPRSSVDLEAGTAHLRLHRI